MTSIVDFLDGILFVLTFLAVVYLVFLVKIAERKRYLLNHWLVRSTDLLFAVMYGLIWYQYREPSLYYWISFMFCLWFCFSPFLLGVFIKAKKS